MKIEEYYAWLKDYFKLNYYKDGRVIRTIYNKENMHDRLQVAYAYYEAVNRNMDWYTKQNIITSIVNIKLNQLREVAKRFYEDSLDENVKLSAYEVSEAFIDNCNTIKEEMMIFKTYADEREKRHSKEIRPSGL